MEPISGFNIAACVVLLLRSLYVINLMSPNTNHGIRIAYVFVAVGSLGVIITPLSQNELVAQVGAFVNIGIAVLLIIDECSRLEKKD